MSGVPGGSGQRSEVQVCQEGILQRESASTGPGGHDQSIRGQRITDRSQLRVGTVQPRGAASSSARARLRTRRWCDTAGKGSRPALRRAAPPGPCSRAARPTPARSRDRHVQRRAHRAVARTRLLTSLALAPVSHADHGGRTPGHPVASSPEQRHQLLIRTKGCPGPSGATRPPPPRGTAGPGPGAAP